MSPPLHRKSSRGKKATDATTSAPNDDPDLPMTTKAPARKRGREPEDIVVESLPIPAKKAKVATTIPDSDPGLRRSGRGPKPNGKATTEKRKRRTKAEVEAAKAAVEEAKRRKDEAAQEAKRRLAQMDFDDEIDRAQTAAKTIRKLSDVEMNVASDLDGEEFVGFNEVSSTSSDESEVVEDLKENYKALKKQMEALKKKMSSGDGSKTKRAGGGKKSTKDRDITYASGLLPDWNAHTAGSKKSSQGITINSGGLEDEDADAVNPYSPRKDDRSKAPKKVIEAGKRDLSRQNELVVVVPKEEIEPMKWNIRPSTKPSGKKPVARTKVDLAAIEIETESEENAPVRKQTKEAKKGDKDRGKKRRVINANNVRIDDLPDFAKDQTWRKTFLPTLYDKFFTSSDPFSQFAKGSRQFISLLHVIMKEVYPNITYKVSETSPIHALAYNRVNEKRSSIGSSAIKVIEKHISTLDGAQAVRDWLLWASRPDGPLFFKEPAAPDAPFNREDPRYVKPGGKLLTTFVIDLVRPFLSLNSGSASINGRPRGLIALAMAALERAVQILRQNESDKVTDFSNGSWGSKVIAYYRNLGNIDETRWNELLDACGIGCSMTDDADEEYQANLSFFDHNRAVMFDFSSPAKP